MKSQLEDTGVSLQGGHGLTRTFSSEASTRVIGGGSGRATIYRAEALSSGVRRE